MRTMIALVATSLLLSACGGGGPSPTAETGQRLAYSEKAHATYSYAPHVSGSNVSVPASETLAIGGDLEPRESLRHIVTTNDGVRVSMGASRDGVGVHRLENYADDLKSRKITDGFKPFRSQPVLVYDADLLRPENELLRIVVSSAWRILNDVLPPEFQIAVRGSRASGSARAGEIMVHLEPPASLHRRCPGATACAIYRTSGRSSLLADVLIPDDFDASEYRLAVKVVVHELAHALGIHGHVDSIEFPDSIMGGSGEYFPNLGHVISRIDREVLQIIYMSQRTDRYNDWGEWTDTSFHLVGRTEDGDLNFGVALFNGLPQPWVRGARPGSDLADNYRVRGTATWNGSLLGFSGPSPIAGDARMRVNVASLSDPDSEQDLIFRDIYFLNRFDSESEDRWFPTRNIDYKVRISGNLFENVKAQGYEQGHVTGAFLGAKHEYMGGTVKRTDMIGAFGGKR